MIKQGQLQFRMLNVYMLFFSSLSLAYVVQIVKPEEEICEMCHVELFKSVGKILTEKFP